jgi:gamma-glutamyl phosphate reductase
MASLDAAVGEALSDPARTLRVIADAVLEANDRDVNAAPTGVVGANFEARPNVAVDVASQVLKAATRSCCVRAVLRSGP